MKRFLSLLLGIALLLSLSMAQAETVKAPSFADFKDLEWTFSSGVGAWYTCIWIQEDGTFTGEFHDGEMGETGEDYPDGSVYGCLFHGKMTLGEQVDAYTWKIHVDEVELDEGQVPEVIEDGIRFVTCDPYGIMGGQDMLLYLPGMPAEQIPEGFLPWAHINEFGEHVDELPYYGLYDSQDETGFIGEPAYTYGNEIIGSWRKAGEEDAASYTLLTISGDGTGALTVMPENMGVPLAWYADGDGWTVCFASPEDTGCITYDADLDQLILVEPVENGDDRVTVYDRDWTQGE